MEHMTNLDTFDRYPSLKTRYLISPKRWTQDSPARPKSTAEQNDPKWCNNLDAQVIPKTTRNTANITSIQSRLRSTRLRRPRHGNLLPSSRNKDLTLVSLPLCFLLRFHTIKIAKRKFHS